MVNAVINQRRVAPYQSNQAEEISRLIFRPLQGFFNAIIFINHKVRNFRKHHPSLLSFYEALKTVFDRREDDPEHIVSNLTLVKRDAAVGGVRFAFDGHHIVSDDDEENSADDSGRLSLKKDCAPEAIEMEGSREGGRANILSPDESVGVSAEDLKRFSQDLSFGRVSMVIDDEYCSSIRKSCGLDNHVLLYRPKKNNATDQSRNTKPKKRH